MTTSETIESHYVTAHAHLSDDELLAEMENIGAVLEGLKNTWGHLEHEVFQRIKERGAKAIPSEAYICEINVKNDYDQLAFTPLKEVFNEADLKECLTPAHTAEVEVKDKWATKTVESLATKYGGQALRIFENARTPTRGRLIFKRRDK